jgi:hypothetical protein
LKMFEELLREAGISKTRAVAIANHGLASLLKREAGGKRSSDDGVNPASTEAALAAIAEFTY